MTDLEHYVEPGKSKLTLDQKQRAVYRSVKNILLEAREEFLKATVKLTEARLRLEQAKNDDDSVCGWNRDVSSAERLVESAMSYQKNRFDTMHGWEEILDFVVMSGLGVKPFKVDYPVVEKGSGI